MSGCSGKGIRQHPCGLGPGHRRPAIIANDSSLWLSTYVFTRDTERGKDLAERMDAGTVMVNEVLTPYGAVEVPLRICLEITFTNRALSS
jgi:hypothetical protein